jgi:hypothetical protein
MVHDLPPPSTPPEAKAATEGTDLLHNYRKAMRQSLAVQLSTRAFHSLRAGDGMQLVFESASGLLWGLPEREGKHVALKLEEARAFAQSWQGGQIGAWRLPTQAELARFAQATGNPLRRGQNFRLCEQQYWMCEGGSFDLNAGNFGVYPAAAGCVIACQALSAQAQLTLLDWTLEHDWVLEDKKLNTLIAGVRHPGADDLKAWLASIDYLSCRLPLLDAAQFTDPSKGVWEAWGQPPERLEAYAIRARNPADDVRQSYVAIDFGTSSTVVAWDDNGRSKLMRIGVKDFFEKPQSAHYENPAVLEFIDFAAMLAAWQERAYRPDVRWDQVRCSHEALHNWRHNETNPVVVASILGRLKHWALRQDANLHTLLSDQLHQIEYELCPVPPRNPVKGQPLTVSTDDPFDPVELYAWFLGMHINWRGRGLFMRYCMTFPVDYPQSVKGSILAAFRRGLQRSLPATLVGQSAFADFTLEERATEPAAYAAIALPTLGIAPGPQGGVAYGVFDFGGGTTDFDFGYYRLPDQLEDAHGYEAVFERCAAAGDKFLGGENLLENMAYRTLLHNLEVCRKHHIAFTRPLDADDFPGSEMFLDQTGAAATNVLMLTARLRPLWESGQLASGSSGVEKIELLTRDGKKVACELAIPTALLQDYLTQRIGEGVVKFFVALQQAFAGERPRTVHVLLAGNASRSPLVLRRFGLAEGEAEAGPLQSLASELDTLLGPSRPEIVVHPPLAPDPVDVYRPTGKTGVALGLLRLGPGGALKVVDHARIAAGNEAPFAYFVGRARHGKFVCGLAQGAPYGIWHELGAPRERVFNLYFTQSPLAHTDGMAEGHTELVKVLLHLAGDAPGHKVYARALAPTRLELCTAASSEAVAQSNYENRRELDLRTCR